MQGFESNRDFQMVIDMIQRTLIRFNNQESNAWGIEWIDSKSL